MKKLINTPDDAVREELEGIALAHPDLVRVSLGPKYIVRADAPVTGKAALVSGGGSGHEPMHGGFVGHGMLHAACPGEVFTSPTPDQILAATKAVAAEGGVLHIGIGIHGEPGRERTGVAPVSEIVERLATPIVEDLPFETGDELLAFVNGMSGTPLMELYRCWRWNDEAGGAGSRDGRSNGQGGEQWPLQQRLTREPPVAGS